MDEQVVHAHGVHPLEEVVGGDGAEVVLELEEGLVDLVDQVRLDGVGEDGVAVLGDPRQVGLEVGRAGLVAPLPGSLSLGVTELQL